MNAWRDHPPFYRLPPQLRADAEKLIAYGGAVSVGGRVLPKVPRTAEILLEQVRHTPPLQRHSQQMRLRRWPFISGHRPWAAMTGRSRESLLASRLRMRCVASSRVLPAASALHDPWTGPHWRGGFEYPGGILRRWVRAPDRTRSKDRCLQRNSTGSIPGWCARWER